MVDPRHERWMRLRRFVEADLKHCKEEALRAKERDVQENEMGWNFASLTNEQILDEMARLEKEEGK